MKAWRPPATNYRSRRVCLWDGCWLLVLGALLLFAGASARASPLVSTQSPIAFFTNVAGRLLQSELNISLSRIQIYPTNQYTPAVHRLLQVTANLYDATTNQVYPSLKAPYLPHVFRPTFNRSGS